MTSIERAWRDAWRPVDRRPIYESLADGDLILGNESPYPGPFDIDNSPQIKTPLDRLGDDTTRRVLLSGAAQLAKTLCGLIFVISVLKRRPGLTTWNGQTNDAIKKVAEDKAWPLFRRSKTVQQLLPKNPNNQRIRSVVFPHMSLRFQSASENNAHSDTVKNQINDERHLWPAGMIHKFLSRVGSMPDHKVLDLSTGSVKLAEQVLEDGSVKEIGDDFFNDWQEGTQSLWSVKCPACSKLQPLAWKHRHRAAYGIGDPAHEGKPLLDSENREVFGIVWDETDFTRPGGRWNYPEVEGTARWRCVFCPHEVADGWDNIRALNALKNGARYVDTNPFASSKIWSGRYPAMVSELVGWGTLVVEWLRAIELAKCGDFGALKKFVQNRLGEAWDDSVTFAGESNPTGDYSLGDDWTDAAGNLIDARRLLTVDRQEGRAGEGVHFWVLCRAWSKEHGSRKVGFWKLGSWEEVRAKEQELAIAKSSHVLVDTGDEAAECYLQCAKYGWTALKGQDREHFAHPNPKNPSKPIMRIYSRPTAADPFKRKGKSKAARALATGARRFARLFNWSTISARDILARLIAGNGAYWGRPKNEPEGYAEQLNSEVKTQIKDGRGRLRWIWKQIKEANHARDLEAMQVVGAILSGVFTPEEEEDTPARMDPVPNESSLSPARPEQSVTRTYLLRG